MLKSDEIYSVYDKINIEEERQLTLEDFKDYKNKVSIAKNIIFNGRLPKNTSFEDQCRILRYIVEEIDHINVNDFDSIYSIKALRTLGVKNLTESMIMQAPESVKIKCAFESKRIIISSTWSEYYENNFEPLTATDIYFCKGELKSGLIRAAKSKPGSVMDGQNTEDVNANGNLQKERSSKAKTVHGKIVDEILYKAMNEFFDNNLTNPDFISKMEYLASYKNYMRKKGEPVAGIFEVIKERGCYANPLDFFMFNSSEKDQTFYLDDYIEIRHKYLPCKDNVSKLIDMIYDSYIKEEEAELE